MRYSKGRRDWYLGQHHAAVELFEEAIEIDPQFASAYAALGNSHGSYIFNEPEKARGYYEKALDLLDRVGDRERYFIQASYQSRFGEPEEAIDSFQQYLDRYPDDAAAHYNLGGIYLELGNCEQATIEYQKVLEIDPDNAGALINTATCISGTNPVEAVSYYREAFQIRPEWEASGNLNHEYGLTLMKSGDEKGAREVFEKRLAAAAPSERGAAQRSLGQLAIYGGGFDSAAEHFESAALLHQDEPASSGRDLVFWALGEVARGRNDRAVELLDEATQLIPPASGWIWLRSIVGLAHLAADDIRGAQAISQELDAWALENDESGLDGLRRREILSASLVAAGGDLDQALETLEGIREVEQADNAFLEWAISETYLRGENWGPAEQSLRTLLDLSWTSYEILVPWIQAHYKLGLVLDHLDNTEEAEAQYRRFLEIWGDTDSSIPEVELARQHLERNSP